MMGKIAESHMRLVMRDRQVSEGVVLEFELNYLSENGQPELKRFHSELLNHEQLLAQRNSEHDAMGGAVIEDCTDPWVGTTLGINLYRDWLPSALRRELETCCRKGMSIRILMENPWIPWERLVFQGQEVAWGRLFALGQWFDHLPIRQVRKVKRIAVIGPKDADGCPDWSVLKGSRALDYVERDLTAIREVFRSDSYDLIHFQGMDKGEGRAELSWDETVITPGILRFQKQEALEGPLVAMSNQSESLTSLLSRTDGWARCMADSGASAFLGCNWEPSPRAGTSFFTSFYDNLFAGMGLGEAARLARTMVALETPLDAEAFVLYGHPNSHCGLRAPVGARLEPISTKIEGPLDSTAPGVPSSPSPRIRQKFQGIDAKGNVKLKGHRTVTEAIDSKQVFSNISADGDIEICGID